MNVPRDAICNIQRGTVLRLKFGRSIYKHPPSDDDVTVDSIRSLNISTHRCILGGFHIVGYYTSSGRMCDGPGLYSLGIDCEGCRYDVKDGVEYFEG